MIAASVYAAARQRHLPRTLDEIAAETTMSKTWKSLPIILLFELSLKIPLADPINYVSRYAAEINLSGRATAAAKNMINEAEKKLLQVKTPYL